jgi:TonB family protein
MKVRKGIIGLGMIVVLAVPLAFPPSTFGQQAPASEVVKRKVKTRVVPDTPPLAKQMNITGRVKIEATISADGKVTSTKVMGGSPVLVDSAIEALKKWRFEPAPKDTTEVIEFDFKGNN